MQELFLLKLGEIVLKGMNRRNFERQLTSNLDVYKRQENGCVRPSKAVVFPFP